MIVVIHHNPQCGTSRNTLEMIRSTGIEPVVIEYLKTGWTRAQLQTLFAGAGLTPRDALRTSKTPAEELGLTNPDVTDDELLDAMVEHPVLVNRPIVVSPKGIRLCRPSEKVYEILDPTGPGTFTKEDGETVVTGAKGS
ncbi:arsenate reductase (glutaredoxin) [Pseudohoeflea suaedae]|uniref:Arsenate reductase n=1 Tax=Pseudohoeflea suaedae TaxID=877384 RepID=A0A4R5PQH6_9HYPH|nr:arsenate reductase (glutaredoxin) [Pseudohoeflea suaedae]TDH38941.1 arsenate reductase (glutaredoxin) [Pseudohoeflea suaedae]